MDKRKIPAQENIMSAKKNRLVTILKQKLYVIELNESVQSISKIGRKRNKRKR
jgi:hypothetical protein